MHVLIYECVCIYAASMYTLGMYVYVYMLYQCIHLGMYIG